MLALLDYYNYLFCYCYTTHDNLSTTISQHDYKNINKTTWNISIIIIYNDMVVLNFWSSSGQSRLKLSLSDIDSGQHREAIAHVKNWIATKYDYTEKKKHVDL